MEELLLNTSLWLVALTLGFTLAILVINGVLNLINLISNTLIPYCKKLRVTGIYKFVKEWLSYHSTDLVIVILLFICTFVVASPVHKFMLSLF